MSYLPLQNTRLRRTASCYFGLFASIQHRVANTATSPRSNLLLQWGSQAQGGDVQPRPPPHRGEQEMTPAPTLEAVDYTLAARLMSKQCTTQAFQNTAELTQYKLEFFRLVSVRVRDPGFPKVLESSHCWHQEKKNLVTKARYPFYPFKQNQRQKIKQF